MTREARSTARRRRLRSAFAMKGLPCHVCGGEIDYRAARGESPLTLHVDHIQPIHQGGKDVDANCAPCHSRCNLSKQDKVTDAYGRLVAAPRRFVTTHHWD